jgi:tetratricopeptide (TPR) repeat protein
MITRLAVPAAVAVLMAAANLHAQCPDGRPPPCGPRRPAAVDDRLGLAVFPFRAATSAEDEWSEAIPDLLTTAMDGTPGVRVADPWALWRNLRADRTAQAESPDPREADAMARIARAQRFVLGSVTRIGTRLNISARFYRVGQAEPLAVFAATGNEDSVGGLVRDVQLRLTSEMAVQRDTAIRWLDARATQNPDALKAYLAAREAMRRGRLDEAERAIDRALALDSTFALAYVEATRIKGSVQFARGQPYSGIEALAERAIRYGDSLSERYRLRARMSLASIRTRGAECARIGERIIELDATDIEAWHQLAYCHTVYGWQYGRDARDAQAAMERVLRLDSTYAGAIALRAALAATYGGPDDLRRQLRRFRGTDTAAVTTHASLMAARAVLASDGEFPALARRIATGPPTDWIMVIRFLRSARPHRAELFLDELERAGPGQGPRVALGSRAQLFVAEGRLAQVDSLLRARAYGDTTALARRVDLFLVASAIAGMSDDSATQRALGRLAGYVPVDSALAYLRNRAVWQTGWALAAWHAAAGDSALTRRWIGAIGTLPRGGGPDWVRSLQDDLDARLAARSGDTARALVLARQALERWGYHANTTFESDPEPAMRLHLALLYRSAGAPDSAQALLRSLVAPTTWMGFLTARASLELGAIAEARGDGGEAARHYRRALALWERGGPEIASWLAKAAEGHRRVSGSRP